MMNSVFSRSTQPDRPTWVALADVEHKVTIRASTYYADDKEAFFVECRLGNWPYSTWGPFNSANEANAVARSLVEHFAKIGEEMVAEMKASTEKTLRD